MVGWFDAVRSATLILLLSMTCSLWNCLLFLDWCLSGRLIIQDVALLPPWVLRVRSELCPLASLPVPCFEVYGRWSIFLPVRFLKWYYSSLSISADCVWKTACLCERVWLMETGVVQSTVVGCIPVLLDNSSLPRIFFFELLG